MTAIEINITEEELQELMEGKEFYWNFDGIDVHIFKGEEE